jgi:hypothetical protein
MIFPTSGVNIPIINSTSIIPIEVITHCMSASNIDKHFKKVFTHQSYDWENSYEAKEFGGDLLCNLFTYKKIARMYPELNPEESTNILSYYKSNEVFGDALKSSIPHVDSVILMGEGFKITEKMYGDVFEALIQAIFDASNSFIPGIGYSCAENVFIYLTRDIEIELKYISGHPKQVTGELLGQKGVVEKQSYETNDGQYYILLEITDLGMSRLIKHFPKIKNLERKYESVAVDKKTASKDVYGELIDTLEKKGITSKSLEEAKMQELIKASPREKDIRKKMAAKKETLSFNKSKTLEGKEWKLVATDNNTGKRYLIVSEEVAAGGSSGFFDTKLNLLAKYIDSDPRGRR